MTLAQYDLVSQLDGASIIPGLEHTADFDPTSGTDGGTFDREAFDVDEPLFLIAIVADTAPGAAQATGSPEDDYYVLDVYQADDATGTNEELIGSSASNVIRSDGGAGVYIYKIEGATRRHVYCKLDVAGASPTINLAAGIVAGLKSF